MKPNSIQIPHEYVELCGDWSAGNMLYAIASTGNLTLGTQRVGHTDEQWYLHIWQELYADLTDTLRYAKGHEDEPKLQEFADYVEDIINKLEEAYGL